MYFTPTFLSRNYLKVIMAQKPDWKNMKVGGAEYTQQVEEGTAELLRARAEKRRAFLAARAAASTSQAGSHNIAPLRDNRLERATAARDPRSLFLTPEPEAQAVVQHISRNDEMIDAPSSPDEPLAARRRISGSSRRSTLNEDENVKSEKTSEGASSSSEYRRSDRSHTTVLSSSLGRPSGTAEAPMVTDRAAPTNRAWKIPRSTLKRAGEASEPNRSNKRRSESAEMAPTDPAPTTSSLPLPEWYLSERPMMRDTEGVYTAMLHIKDHIRDLDKAQKQSDEASKQVALKKIRDWLHKMEHQTVTGGLLKGAKLLDVQNLPKLFHNLPRTSPMTFDIVADAKALYRKWARADFDADVLRGIIGRSTNRSIDPRYPVRAGFKFWGTGDLVSGQWWPLRIATLRDGAHGAMQGGISGERGQGAYSIVVAGQYDDVDSGDTLEYCGTPDQTNRGQITDDTQLLRDSCRTKNPVRVLRSGNNKGSNAKGSAHNKYLPTSGYRYDGVYTVVEEKLLDQKEALWRFTLKRQPNQDAIRFEGPYARPSLYDEQAYARLKELGQLSKGD